jgi:hypothetical protein
MTLCARYNAARTVLRAPSAALFSLLDRAILSCRKDTQRILLRVDVAYSCEQARADARAMAPVHVPATTNCGRKLSTRARAHGLPIRCDYVIGETRVVANPFGYPKELHSNEMFEPTLHVEI